MKKIYTFSNGAVSLAHTYDFGEEGIMIDGQKTNVAYKNVWNGWTSLGHYDFDGYVDSRYPDPEYSMDKTRALIENTKNRIGG